MTNIEEPKENYDEGKKEKKKEGKRKSGEYGKLIMRDIDERIITRKRKNEEGKDKTTDVSLHIFDLE